MKSGERGGGSDTMWTEVPVPIGPTEVFVHVPSVKVKDETTQWYRHGDALFRLVQQSSSGLIEKDTDKETIPDEKGSTPASSSGFIEEDTDKETIPDEKGSTPASSSGLIDKDTDKELAASKAVEKESGVEQEATAEQPVARRPRKRRRGTLQLRRNLAASAVDEKESGVEQSATAEKELAASAVDEKESGVQQEATAEKELAASAVDEEGSGVQQEATAEKEVATSDAADKESGVEEEPTARASRYPYTREVPRQPLRLVPKAHVRPGFTPWYHEYPYRRKGR